LSFNSQARSGLQDQLAGRYIPQVAATGGVFVLVWMEAPRLSPTYRPLWATLAEAQQDLNQLADEENARPGSTAHIRVAFIDASLPTVAGRKRPSSRKRETKKPPAAKGVPSRKKTPDKKSMPKRKAQALRSRAKRHGTSGSHSVKPSRTKQTRRPKVR